MGPHFKHVLTVEKNNSHLNHTFFIVAFVANWLPGELLLIEMKLWKSMFSIFPEAPAIPSSQS